MGGLESLISTSIYFKLRYRKIREFDSRSYKNHIGSASNTTLLILKLV